MGDGKPIRRNAGQSPGRKPSREDADMHQGPSKDGATSQRDIVGEMLEGLTDAELNAMGSKVQSFSPFSFANLPSLCVSGGAVDNRFHRDYVFRILW